MTSAAERNDVVLEGYGLSKYFGSVVANHRVNLDIRRGEVLAIVGDNGAGKSTLIRMLCGALRPDEGEIRHRGVKVEFKGPYAARRRGIETVWQELAVAPSIDVAGNVYAGREIVRGRSRLLRMISPLNGREMTRSADERLRALEISIPGGARALVGQLSGGQRQAVAVARAAAWATDVLFMDEPTAALGVRQSRAVLTLASRIAQRGLGVVMISHTLPQVLEFADRVVVLRHGRKVADLSKADATEELLVSLIVGFTDHRGESDEL